MKAVLSVVWHRALHALPVLVGAVCLNFLLLRLIPGDAVDVLLSGTEGATQAYIDQLRASFGFDQPLYIQLFRYLRNVAQFDLGYSLIYSRPVLELILGALWPTLLLMLSSICVSFAGGLLLGVYSARHVHSARDNIVSVFSVLAFATPSFWLGLMMITLFSVKLGWLPVGGYSTIGESEVGIAHVVDVLRHLLLPTIALALIHLATYARVMRASMLEVISLDYVRTAKAKGLGANQVIFRHVVRNALLPMVTLLSLQLGALLGGAIVVESIFAWPGLGRLAQDAVLQRDYNLLLGILFFSAILVVVLNLVADAAYAALDPRVESLK